MAAAFHVRSNSLPSSLNPLAAQVDEHLSRLRSSETASTSSSSTCKKLNDLQDLMDCINQMLQQSVHQQALSQEQNREMVEGLLDGSLRLLDVCSVSKDALASKKSLKKSFQMVSKSLKATDAKQNKDETLMILREAEAATVDVFASLLCFISRRMIRGRLSAPWTGRDLVLDTTCSFTSWPRLVVTWSRTVADGHGRVMDGRRQVIHE